mmetsp:Transcript_98109/g.283023  ORF Transcript_98109/g.283023 Transcript_98109/m.283023 type:complete len:124 (+) Transcript_98109:885-1256(+)
MTLRGLPHLMRAFDRHGPASRPATKAGYLELTANTIDVVVVVFVELNADVVVDVVLVVLVSELNADVVGDTVDASSEVEFASAVVVDVVALVDFVVEELVVLEEVVVLELVTVIVVEVVEADR